MQYLLKGSVLIGYCDLYKQNKIQGEFDSNQFDFKLPFLLQSGFPRTLVRGTSVPCSFTHQQYPVDPQHCSGLKLPSTLHSGTNAPTNPSCEA